ncbi:CoA-binding protein [Fodinibius salsisoli]|uniref:CoA-binding protein n=1 Tax=Fodinibius salsisoli TaxID=2820877 RepID=A0ABT3PNR6_9BACT|nr:CoA-binding protein [Fodinibius salsisoli]MCW9707494.1 CoA-binding protein [Fodinibius salsisoli]
MRTTFNNWYDQKMRATEELNSETNRAEETLSAISSIAIVGLSRSFHKDSQFVGRYLQNAGYTIVPVNPNADTILGEKAYPDLKSIPSPVDAIDVFLPPDYIHKAVDQALELDPQPRAIWLQLGTGKQPEQIDRVRGTGIELYENRCIKVDHQFLIRPKEKKGKLTN